MASVFPLSRTHENREFLPSPSKLARAVTLHSSLAVLTFAALQVCAVVALAQQPGGSMLPFVALAVLILLFIPFARRIERRWRNLAAAALPSDGLLVSFRRDRQLLWRLALIGPLAWVALFMLVMPFTA